MGVVAIPLSATTGGVTGAGAGGTATGVGGGGGVRTIGVGGGGGTAVGLVGAGGVTGELVTVRVTGIRSMLVKLLGPESTTYTTAEW
ncbi:MAG: hypothetical protein WAS50_15350, partial [Nitrospira sp.]